MARAAEVDAYFEALEHPLKSTMEAVRREILAADKRMTESIKWKSPTFEYRGNLASINPRAKQFVSLMFHVGQKIPGELALIPANGDTSAYMRFADEADVKRQRAALRAVVKAWCDWKDE